jgi:hypothetical protein
MPSSGAAPPVQVRKLRVLQKATHLFDRIATLPHQVGGGQLGGLQGFRAYKGYSQVKGFHY